MKKVLLLAFQFLCVIAFAQTPKNNAAKPKLTLYKDTINKFSLMYPNDWTIRVPDTTQKAKVFVRSPKESDDDKFTENINVMIREGSISFSLKEIQTTIKASLETKIKNYALVREKLFKTNGVDAYQIEYTASNKTGDTELDLYVAQRIFYKNKMKYTITYVSVKDKNEDYYKKALAVFDSFKILGK